MEHETRCGWCLCRVFVRFADTKWTEELTPTTFIIIVIINLLSEIVCTSSVERQTASARRTPGAAGRPAVGVG